MTWRRRPWETDWDFVGEPEPDYDRPSLWDEASDEERAADEEDEGDGREPDGYRQTLGGPTVPTSR
jgi:hypothetical protein